MNQISFVLVFEKNIYIMIETIKINFKNSSTKRNCMKLQIFQMSQIFILKSYQAKNIQEFTSVTKIYFSLD